MLLPEENRIRYVSILAITLALVWCFRLLILDVPATVSSLLFGSTQRLNLNETEFIRQAFETEFPTSIDYAPIREICAKAPFRPGLVFTCEEQHGGVGMVRNQILKCIRYAIAGGGALVVPSMQLRNAKDISEIETSNEVGIEHLFEREVFKQRLTMGCPGMRLYDRVEDFPFYNQQAGPPLDLLGDHFEPGYPKETGLQHSRDWRASFDRWLESQGVQPWPTTPVHIRMQQSFMEYPVRVDGDAFVNEFGKILSFRNDTRQLAAKVLHGLNQRFQLSLDPKRAMHHGAYYGAHLRLEKDAIDAWPPSEWPFSAMDRQFEAHFQDLLRSGLNVVYVASGNQTVVKLFAEYLSNRPELSEKNVTVVTKYDFLEGADRALLDSMSFDRQGLVDFMIMFKASKFMGVASSSFPWTVALRRHELSRYSAFGNEGSDLLRDEWSTIMGMKADYPYLDPFLVGIWP